MTVIRCTSPAKFNRHTSRTRRAADAAPDSTCPIRNLMIGLINNMSDSALEATERQFVSLLEAAAEGVTVRLHFLFLPGVTRSGASAQRVREFYSSAEALQDFQLDGLIVTGREPLTPNLADEPYWDSFGAVLEWARNHTYSTVWSCLAAHAAVLYQHGIQRVKSERKHFGVFECERVSSHTLTEGIPYHFTVPHSRWNGLREEELAAHGYKVLSRAMGAGVDMFVQEHKSLFVFFQGHPEYEYNTPLLEYRRDIGRFLRSEMDVYPTMPKAYFDADSQARLTMLQEEAERNPREELLAEVSKALEDVRVKHSWKPTATSIYGNWLRYLYSQKQAHWERARAAERVTTSLGVDTYVPEPEIAVPLNAEETNLIALP